MMLEVWIAAGQRVVLPVEVKARSAAVSTDRGGPGPSRRYAFRVMIEHQSRARMASPTMNAVGLVLAEPR